MEIPNKKNAENAQKFYCDLCDFTCSKKSNYDKHLLTRKHKILINPNEKNAEDINKDLTCACGKNYKHQSTLCAHKKKCPIINSKNDCDSSSESDTSSESDNEAYENELLRIDNLVEIVKQNSEFKELILEQNKIIADLAKNCGNYNNNINSNNKTFNLNMFLNEKCKDAMNIDEFVDSLKLTFTDLENVGEMGFVDGISRIFINGLKKLDVYKRPIHCSDLKREVMHLKEDGVWSKDNENNDSMKKVVKMIANKNINTIYEWKNAYPSHRYSDDPKNDIYLKFLYQSMGGTNKEEDILFYNKIVKKIARETVIDKNYK